MDPIKIEESTKLVLAEIPGLEGFISDTRQKLTASFREAVTDSVAALADGISDLARLGYSINGATVTIEPTAELVVSVRIPKFTITAHVPLIKD